MKYLMIVNVLGLVLQFQAMFLLLPCMVSGIYREHEGFAFLGMAVVCAVTGTLCRRIKTENKQIYAREGLVIVAFACSTALTIVLGNQQPRTALFMQFVFQLFMLVGSRCFFRF